MEAAKAQEAAKDPKAGTAAAGDDLSMEEILHSIRKIIAEDDTDGKKPNGKKGEENVPGSDVLELTEMLKEDGSVVSLKPEAAAAAPAGPPDILKSIDQALTPEKSAEKPAAPAAPAAAAAAPAAAPAASAPAAPAEPLLSAEAASAAATSLKNLKAAANPEPPAAATTPSPIFRSGTTVEDMVMEMLKPMLKDWLDKNLPAIVQNIVEREVKKLTK
jgi:cell pole-organizing protein PopZ